MWFGKAIQDFNDDVSKIGQDAPQLHASTSNGFISERPTLTVLYLRLNVGTVIWVAYAFYAVPLVCSLAKMHVSAGPAPGKA